MASDLITKLTRKVWTHVLGDSSWINRYGTFRMREQYGLIARANYLYGMLRAADVAKYCGKQSVTVIEFDPTPIFVTEIYIVEVCGLSALAPIRFW